MKFIHKISKGSNFNQIYVPREMEAEFEVGDFVEVILLEKSVQLFYSENLPKLTKFKEKLSRDIFSSLNNYNGVKQIFLVGSFLTKNIEYNDIDLIIITKKENEVDEKKIYNLLIDKINLQFHIILIEEDRLNNLLKICPLIRSMFYYCISNKKIMEIPEKEINIEHLRFLLMLPEDLLKIGLEDGKVYYDALRKLITIENFLKNDEIAPDKIDNELEKIIEKRKLIYLKENGAIRGAIKKDVNKIIKNKLDLIYKYLKNGEKRQYK